MPSKSKSQHNLMAAVAHNPKFAKKLGIPTKVGKDFMKADSLKDLSNLSAKVKKRKKKGY